MVDVRGDVLRPPHGTTPAAVKVNKNLLRGFLNTHSRAVTKSDVRIINVESSKPKSVTSNMMFYAPEAA